MFNDNLAILHLYGSYHRSAFFYTILLIFHWTSFSILHYLRWRCFYYQLIMVRIFFTIEFCRSRASPIIPSIMLYRINGNSRYHKSGLGHGWSMLITRGNILASGASSPFHGILLSPISARQTTYRIFHLFDTDISCRPIFQGCIKLNFLCRAIQLFTTVAWNTHIDVPAKKKDSRIRV